MQETIMELWGETLRRWSIAVPMMQKQTIC